MAIVPSKDVLMHPKLKQPFVIPFGKNQFNVPKASVLHAPKYSNKLETIEDLQMLLSSSAPERWEQHLDPRTILHLEGVDASGESCSCLYTSFEVPGYDQEGLIFRQVTANVAKNAFPLIEQKVQDQIKEGSGPHSGDPAARSEHQVARYKLLEWRKETHCPSVAQLLPKTQGWTALEKSEEIKSCLADAKKKKPASTKRKYVDEYEMIKTIKTYEADDLKKWDMTLTFPSGNPPTIIKKNGFLEIIAYNDGYDTDHGAGVGATDAEANDDMAM